MMYVVLKYNPYTPPDFNFYILCVQIKKKTVWKLIGLEINSNAFGVSEIRITSQTPVIILFVITNLPNIN